jgi:UbiD family decarboxylase
MGVADLRDWLARAEKAGEVQSVDGAHWDLEIGALSQVNYRRGSPKALLFDTIKDYPAGWRVLSGSVSNPRLLGSVLGMGWDCTDEGLLDVLAVAPGEWARRAPEFRAVAVADGPLLSTVVGKDDVDLLAFPVPRWHEGDGGRYIGTGCAVVTRDYDTGRINLGAYRMQVQDEGRSVSVNIEAGKHGAQHLRRWFEAEGRRASRSPAMSRSTTTSARCSGLPSRPWPGWPRDCRCRTTRRSRWRAGCGRSAPARRGRSASGPATTPGPASRS